MKNNLVVSNQNTERGSNSHRGSMAAVQLPQLGKNESFFFGLGNADVTMRNLNASQSNQMNHTSQSGQLNVGQNTMMNERSTNNSPSPIFKGVSSLPVNQPQ